MKLNIKKKLMAINTILLLVFFIYIMFSKHKEFREPLQVILSYLIIIDGFNFAADDQKLVRFVSVVGVGLFICSIIGMVDTFFIIKSRPQWLLILASAIAFLMMIASAFKIISVNYKLKKDKKNL